MIAGYVLVCLVDLVRLIDNRIERRGEYISKYRHNSLALLREATIFDTKEEAMDYARCRYSNGPELYGAFAITIPGINALVPQQPECEPTNKERKIEPDL